MNAQGKEAVNAEKMVLHLTDVSKASFLSAQLRASFVTTLPKRTTIENPIKAAIIEVEGNPAFQPPNQPVLT